MEESNSNGRTILTDNKGFINKNDAFFKSIEKSFDNNEPVKLDQLLNKMKNDGIDDEAKKKLCIIQFGFVITNKKNEILLINRTKKSHLLTKNESIVQSVSPSSNPKGEECPYYLDYVKSYYERQVKCDIKPSSFNFLAIIKNTIKNKDIDYIFYIFQIKYNKNKSYFESEGLVKDSKLKLINQLDELKGFIEIDKEDIIDKIKNKKVDLRVAELLSGKKFGHSYGASKIFINPNRHSMKSLFSADIKDHNYPQTFQIFNKKIINTKRNKKIIFILEISSPFILIIINRIKDILSLNFIDPIFYIFLLFFIIYYFIKLILPKKGKSDKNEVLNYNDIINNIKDITWKYMTKTKPYENNNNKENKIDKRFIENIRIILKKLLGKRHNIDNNTPRAKEITKYMRDLREQSFDAHKFYYEKYIENQKKYYIKELNKNKRSAKFFNILRYITILFVMSEFIILFHYRIFDIINLVENTLFFIIPVLTWSNYKKFPDLINLYSSAIINLEKTISEYEQHINSEAELSNYINKANNILKNTSDVKLDIPFSF